MYRTEKLSSGEIKNPVHFTQIFGIDAPDEEISFFDTNLAFDTPVFVDPFLLKRSSDEREQRLFERFGDFFRYAYDQAIMAQGKPKEAKSLEALLTFREPKEVCLGYTEHSNEGSGTGLVFVNNLVKFFLNNTARRLVKEDSLYPDGKFNPMALEVFVDKLGQDGISDITVNLIIDYLIEYTWEICKQYDIKIKSLPVKTDGFDFKPAENEWRGGGYYKLPENPLRPGQAVILVPKRLLRAEQTASERYKANIKYILDTDTELSRKFSDFLSKKTGEATNEQIRQMILQDNSVLKKYIEYLEKKGVTPYNFDNDILCFYANKKYSNKFEALKVDNNIQGNAALVERINDLIDLFEEEISQKDGWKDVWVFDGRDPKRPTKEVVIGRIFRAMGNSYFALFPKVHFLPESETGNGFVDFRVIYEKTNVAIELKKIANSQPVGSPPLAGYIHGVQRQLPDYIERLKADYGIYLTIQHFCRENKPRGNHDYRVQEVEGMTKIVEKKLHDNMPNFTALYYRNIKVPPKRTASKI